MKVKVNSWFDGAHWVYALYGNISAGYLATRIELIAYVPFEDLVVLGRVSPWPRKESND